MSHGPRIVWVPADMAPEPRTWLDRRRTGYSDRGRAGITHQLVRLDLIALAVMAAAEVRAGLVRVS